MRLTTGEYGTCTYYLVRVVMYYETQVVIQPVVIRYLPDHTMGVSVLITAFPTAFPTRDFHQRPLIFFCSSYVLYPNPNPNPTLQQCIVLPTSYLITRNMYVYDLCVSTIFKPHLLEKKCCTKSCLLGRTCFGNSYTLTIHTIESQL